MSLTTRTTELGWWPLQASPFAAAGAKSPCPATLGPGSPRPPSTAGAAGLASTTPQPPKSFARPRSRANPTSACPSARASGPVIARARPRGSRCATLAGLLLPGRPIWWPGSRRTRRARNWPTSHQRSTRSGFRGRTTGTRRCTACSPVAPSRPMGPNSAGRSSSLRHCRQRRRLTVPSFSGLAPRSGLRPGSRATPAPRGAGRSGPPTVRRRMSPSGGDLVPTPLQGPHPLPLAVRCTRPLQCR